MLREQIAPRLRALGFKGSGQAYSLPSRTHFATIGFQKAKWSEAASLSFTANVTVAECDIWEKEREVRPYLPAKPSPNTYYGDYIWQKRIGFLLPAGQDQWWDVGAGMSTDALADEVVAAIHEYALPAMRARLEPCQVRFASAAETPRPTNTLPDA
jgi:hypothetical protein